MADGTHDNIRFSFNLKNDAVITDAQFEQSFEIALERFWGNLIV